MQHILSNRTRPISLRAHGVMDYLFGLLLMLAPWIFGFSGDPVPTQSAVALATVVFFYSIITDYELGLIKMLHFRAHLWLDLVVGLLLVTAPWLMQMSGTARIVLVGFGLFALLAYAFTRRPHPNVPS